ncbi:GNAT family protein [Amycolatopsis sp. La24]|uniref:GNAT family N-acetyltransferase n=1 Tax=Amycolatopsis sp. La24 TaxID=3028304 RepID=UPI0031B5FF6C
MGRNHPPLPARRDRPRCAPWPLRARLGSEAIRVLAQRLFDQGHHRITIDPAAANHRAIHVYEKLGFRRVGILRDYEQGPDGTWHDGLLMDLLKGELKSELK